MGLFQAFNISASGMTAERFRTDIIAQNIANVNTTSTKEGTPYRRKIVTFSEKNVTPFSQIYSSSKKAAVGNGVKVSSVTSDYSTDFIKEYDPSNQTINYRQLIHVRMDWKHLKSSVHKSTMLLFLI